MGKIEYLSGQKIHNVTFIEEVPSDKDRRAKFMCSCGGQFVAWIHSVKSNVTKSCGCLRREFMRNKQTKHGHSRHPLYNVYNNMIERCTTESSVSYKRYGKRGVKVCEEWLNSFDIFFEWAINNGWKDGLQLDKDTNGNGMLYSPETCCFITPKENSNKRSRNRLIEYNGATKTMAEWSDCIGIRQSTIHARLKAGWDIYNVLYTPVKNGKNGR